MLRDKDIEPEDKFQYLILATVSGSCAKEEVQSFPPPGAKYEKSPFGRKDILV